MSRTLRAGWACALAVLAAGCQDYNFNPVGHCVIQPGTKEVTLSSVSTADVLFVVDDSGSMGGEQQNLAKNFSTFIASLDNANAARAGAGLDPFEFHIAVTSTSVFWNYQTANTCTSSCAGAAGQLVCCAGGAPARQPKACTSNTQCTVAGTTCRTDCPTLKGSGYCCAAPVPPSTTPTFPAGSISEVIPCSREGTICGTLEQHYDFSGTTCDPGVAADQYPFPAGDFVSWTSGATANPRVLHFDKSLYPAAAAAPATLNIDCTKDATKCSAGETCVAASNAAGAPKFCRASCTTSCASGFTCVASACQPTNSQGFTTQDLVNFFAGSPAGTNANVITGTCGSGEEQGFNAAKFALEKAVAGQQKDTYAASPGKVVTWDPATRTAGSAAQWLHPNSKLVLVFIGDEDDCSSPVDPSGGVVMLGGTNQGPGNDACTRDATTAAPVGQKESTVQSFVDYFTGLGRPLGAAFIESAAQTSCSGIDPNAAGSCTPGTCCQPDCPSLGVCGNDSQCGGQAPASRFFTAAGELKSAGADVVAGSICDPDFGTILAKIAELVKPPTGLKLPSLPAANEVTLLRIATSNDQTRKVCTSGPLAPLAPPNNTLQDAQATGAGWWFTPDGNPGPPVTGPTLFVYINPSGDCIANPGETYSADYLGRLPAGGCWDDPTYTPIGGESVGDAMCRSILGGSAGDWTCFSDTSGTCAATIPQTKPGTCICGSRAANCAP